MAYLVAGNWKTHLVGRQANELARQLARLTGSVAVFPPAVYAPRVVGALADSEVAVGLQDISEQGPGATTGEICAEQACDIGAKFVLVGHSERRTRHNESVSLTVQKVLAAQRSGLKVILCVGESLEARQAGEHEATVLEQLLPVVEAIDGDQELIVAYEPVWAIGTGETASPEQAEEMHVAIRAVMPNRDWRVLYGGSVNAGNAKALAQCANIDGALVGGASLKFDEFAAIVAAFQE